jgi:hypothetical protein
MAFQGHYYFHHVVYDLEDFKEWILEDRKAFPDMRIIIVDERNKTKLLKGGL